MTFAWRPESQYHVATTRGADSVLASDCRAQFERMSHLCVTVRLPVRPRRETVYWQANANTPFPLPPFEMCPIRTLLRVACCCMTPLPMACTQIVAIVLGAWTPSLLCCCGPSPAPPVSLGLGQVRVARRLTATCH